MVLTRTRLHEETPERQTLPYRRQHPARSNASLVTRSHPICSIFAPPPDSAQRLDPHTTADPHDTVRFRGRRVRPDTILHSVQYYPNTTKAGSCSRFEVDSLPEY